MRNVIVELSIEFCLSEENRGKKMLYNSIIARSFSKHEQKKFRYGAMFSCLLLALSFCTVLRPYFGPLSVLNLRVSTGDGLKMLMVRDTGRFQRLFKNNGSSPQHTLDDTSSSKLIANDTNNTLHIVKVPDFVPKKIKPVCSITKQSDFCQIRDHTKIEASSGTVFIASSKAAGSLAENSSWIIRPYARKTDETAMNNVREWSVKSVMSSQNLLKCTQNHSVPAILFSTGGYGGNYFHDFSDILIPLYLTSRQFNGEVQFLVTNKKSWWIEKFRKLLQNLSKYDIIEIDKQTTDVHCFPGGIIGLKRHDNKELNIDPSKSSCSMKDFREFIRNSYSLQKYTAIKMKDGQKKSPQLLIISRKRTRSFTNAGKIAEAARKLGYKVVVAEADMNVPKFAEIVNSCDVLLGLHGAGLTNIVFLPETAVLIQVVPIAVEWLAKASFEEPSKAMNLRYLAYKIKPEESSLIQKYPIDHEVIRNPSSIGKQGWNSFKSLYLDKQNVQLDLNRIRGTLLKALELLHN